MAGAAPDTPIRSLPSWAHQEANQIPEEALSALETYKKKDPAKGDPYQASSLVAGLHYHLNSCRTLQSCWQCANYEAELL